LDNSNLTPEQQLHFVEEEYLKAKAAKAQS
jgi:cytidylate kinase